MSECGAPINTKYPTISLKCVRPVLHDGPHTNEYTLPEDCPAHSEEGMYRAVRQNRRNLGMEPQGCTCGGAA